MTWNGLYKENNNALKEFFGFVMIVILLVIVAGIVLFWIDDLFFM